MPGDTFFLFCATTFDDSLDFSTSLCNALHIIYNNDDSATLRLKLICCPIR